MGLLDAFKRAEIISSDETNKPLGDNERAAGGIYLSEVLPMFEDAGFDMSNDELRGIAIEGFGRVLDSAKKRRAGKVEKNQQTVDAFYGNAQRKLGFDVSTWSFGAIANQGIEVSEDVLEAIKKRDEIKASPYVGSDILFDDTSDGEGLRLRQLRDGDIAAKKTTPLLARLPMRILEGFTSDRIRFADTRAPGDEQGAWDKRAEGVAKFGGAGAQIALLSRAGLGPAALGAHMALAPDDDLKKTPEDFLKSFTEGTALGIGVGATGGVAADVTRSLASRLGPRAAMAAEKALRGQVGKTHQSGMTGVQMTAYESIKHGELPRPGELLDSYIGFALGHLGMAGSGSLSPAARTKRMAGRRMHKWLKETNPEAREMARLYKEGRADEYFRMHARKVREFEEQVRAERSGEEWTTAEEIAAKEAEEAFYADRDAQESRAEDAAEQHYRVKEETESLGRMAERGQANVDMGEDAIIGASDAARTVVREIGISRNQAKKIIAEMPHQKGENGRKLYRLGDVISAAAEAGKPLDPMHVGRAKKRNASDPTLRTYKTQRAAKLAAAKARKAEGKEVDIYEETDGTWRISHRGDRVDATQDVPSVGAEPNRPGSRTAEAKVGREKAALKRMGVERGNSRGSFAERRRKRTEELNKTPEQRMAERDAAAREEALASGAKTPDEARAERMAASAKSAADVRAKVEKDAPGTRVMPPEQIVAVAREEGGQARLEAAGYTRKDIFRAVGEVKQKQREAEGGGKVFPKTDKNGNTDVVLGFGIGGGAEQFKDAIGLAGQAIPRTAKGVYKGGRYAAEGVVWGVDRFVLGPMDWVGEGATRVHYKHIGKPLRVKTDAMGDWLSQNVFTRIPGYGRVAAKARAIAPLHYMPEGDTKSALLGYVDGRRVIGHDAHVKSFMLNKLVEGGRDALNQQLRERGERRLTEDEHNFLFYNLVQYGGVAKNGARPGIRQIEMLFAKAEAEGIKIDPVIREKADKVIDYLERMESLPAEFQHSISQAQDYFAALGETATSLGIIGGLAELPPGVTYLPEAAQVELYAKGGKVKRRRGRGTEAPEANKKHVLGGFFERRLFFNTAPATFHVPSLYRTSHANIMGAAKARDTVLSLTGYEVDGMPAATTLSGIKARLGDGADGWIARSEYSDFEGVPGFNLPKTRGNPDKLMFHPDVAKVIGNLTDVPMSNFATKINAAMKISKLTFSPFHFWALAMNTVAYGENPLKASRNLEQLLLSDSARNLVEHGLTLTDSDVYHAGVGYERIFGNPDNQAKRIMKLASKTERFISRKLWDKWYVATKIASAEAATRKLMDLGLTESGAMREASQAVNKLHGGVDWHWYGMSTRTKQILSQVMLAPDWVISNTASSASAIKGLSPVAKPQDVMNRNAFARYAVGTYVMGNVMNVMLSGHPMWENDDDHKHQIEIGIMGDPVWVDPWGHFGETFRVLIGAANVVAPSEFGETYGRDPVRYAQGKLSMIGQATVMGATGRDRVGAYLPTAMDIAAGRTRGKKRPGLGEIEAYIGGVASLFTPITLENTTRSLIEADSVKDFYSDHRFLSGVIGRHVYEGRGHRTSSGKRRRRSSRPRR